MHLIIGHVVDVIVDLSDYAVAEDRFPPPRNINTMNDNDGYEDDAVTEAPSITTPYSPLRFKSLPLYCQEGTISYYVSAFCKNLDIHQYQFAFLLSVLLSLLGCLTT